MTTGESLTRGTIWIALSLYTAGELLRAARNRSAVRAYPKWLYSIACVFFLAHVVSAFQFYHHWSHAAAYDETARQTAAAIGVRSGGGLLLNYAFAILWMVDVFWQWIQPRSHSRRPRSVDRFVRFLFFFMIINGAVVFARSPMRWFGLLLSILLAASWWLWTKPLDPATTN